MANSLAIEPHESGEETASGTGDPIDIGALRSLVKLSLDITAISGTGAGLTVVIETSPNETGPWRQIGSFARQTTATPVKTKTVAGCQRYVRVTWAIAGTDPVAVTFAVYGAAHVLYATSDDLDRYTLPDKATAALDAEVKADGMLAATDEADGYLGGGYTLPLTAWGEDLKMHVAKMASFQLMSRRGYRPGESDDLIIKGREDAISWLTQIMHGRLEPPGIVDSTPDEQEYGAYVASGCPRGW